MTKVKARSFDKVLKAPDSVTTIREALRKFEKTWNKKDKEKLQSVATPATTTATTVSSTATDEVTTVVSSSEKVDSNVVVTVEEKTNKKTGIASIVEESTPEEEDETMREIYDRPSPSPTEEITKSAANSLTTTAESEEPLDQVRAPSPPTIIDEPFVIADADLPAPKPSTAEKVVEQEISSSESVVIVEDGLPTQNGGVNDVESMQVVDVENIVTSQNEDEVMISSEDIVASTLEKASQSDDLTNDEEILRKAVEILKRRSTIDVFNFIEQIIQMAKNKE